MQNKPENKAPDGFLQISTEISAEDRRAIEIAFAQNKTVILPKGAKWVPLGSLARDASGGTTRQNAVVLQTIVLGGLGIFAGGCLAIFVCAAYWVCRAMIEAAG